MPHPVLSAHFTTSHTENSAGMGKFPQLVSVLEQLHGKGVLGEERVACAVARMHHYVSMDHSGCADMFTHNDIVGKIDIYATCSDYRDEGTALSFIFD